MRRRRLAISIAGLALAAAAAEAILRLGWGFGTPVLYEWDSRFEYRMVPNQAIRRFGRRIETNSLGLRCREFAPARTDPAELRVLVLGDSVVNGGSHVDQPDLCTARLERMLSERLGRPALVINASANSWGPPNEEAFVNAFGTFDADIAILVLSSHDLVDVPNNTAAAQAGSGNTFNRPLCALTEVAGMAWARLVPTAMPSPPSEEDAVRTAQSLTSLRALLTRLHAEVPHVAVALHWDREEQAARTPRRAHRRLAEAVAEARLDVWDLGPSFVDAAASGQRVLMHDRIHPTDEGQAVLADELFRRLMLSEWASPSAAARE